MRAAKVRIGRKASAMRFKCAGVRGRRETHQRDAAVVDEVEHADARERLRDEVREVEERGAARGERREGRDGRELRDGVDRHEHLGRLEVLAEPEVQPARCGSAARSDVVTVRARSAYNDVPI